MNMPEQKQADLDEIRTFVNGPYKTFTVGDIYLCLHYGSKKPGSDRDLFTVIPNFKGQKALVCGDYDVSQIDKEDFVRKLELLDPEYTEPILNGELIVGEGSVLEDFRMRIQKIEPGKRSLDYLMHRSFENLLQAKNAFTGGDLEIFYKTIKSGNPTIKTSLIGDRALVGVPSTHYTTGVCSLCYSLSYMAFKERYEKGSEVLTLNEILESPLTYGEELLVKVRSSFKEHFNSWDLRNVDKYMKETEEYLHGRLLNDC